MMMVNPVRHVDCFFHQINSLHLAFHEVHSPQQLADRIDYTGQVEVAGRDFVEHGREEEEVLPIHNRDVHIRITAEGLLELQGHIQAAKSPAQNYDTHVLCSPITHAATSQYTLMAPFAPESFSNSSLKFSRPATGCVIRRRNHPG